MVPVNRLDFIKVTRFRKRTLATVRMLIRESVRRSSSSLSSALVAAGFSANISSNSPSSFSSRAKWLLGFSDFEPSPQSIVGYPVLLCSCADAFTGVVVRLVGKAHLQPEVFRPACLLIIQLFVSSSL
eukprot:GILK01001842.1.p1 GENE.GILK01001842.1~~GILK01001842.1.p1  ORF type:complete len:128 (-),score=14.96 GILK01001842.1:190-573(-)